MKVHALQHVPFEGIGSMEAWLTARGAHVTYTRFFEPGAALPDDSFDLVIVMGGPMSVNDEAALPWLKAEKAFLRDGIKRGDAILGICLGAQLIASAMGARVYPNAEKEIGWLPITGTADREGLFRFPLETTVLHWHGETFDLPKGAKRLARSVACENQAFQLGERIIGLQFHLETTAESLEEILGGCADELQPAPYVQTAKQLRAGYEQHNCATNSLMGEILAYLLFR